MRREESGMVGGEIPSRARSSEETPGSSPPLFSTHRDAYGIEHHTPSSREGREAGRRGMQMVKAHAALTDRQQLDNAIAILAASSHEFVPEDVRRLLPETWGGHPNLVGSRINYFLRQGLIKRTGERRPGTAVSQRGRRVDVLRGTA